MKIALAGDHAGFLMKEAVKKHLEDRSVVFEDLGTYSTDSVDYPDFAFALAEKVTAGQYSSGILFCGTGIGMSIAANKVCGIRAALCHDAFTARMARLHNDANILVLGAGVIGQSVALGIVDLFLETAFQGGRHQRRLEKIKDFESRLLCCCERP